MTRIGFYSFAIGTSLLAAPAHAIFKKFGAITSESIIRWYAELPLQEYFQVRLTVWLGLMLVTWGLLA